MNRRIDVITDDVPECPRCGRTGLLYARVPNDWQNAADAWVEGYIGVVLCPDCNARDRHAAPLITWFHVNGAADDEDAEFVRLLVAWAAGVFVPALDERALGERTLREETERRRLGDL
ncbi:DUF6300 family protein [Nonomuraea sp. NPDC050643]|uniref:DUF6300 family protein n=1 Tax=Nonomuraea sp. NPDC050643 TaxID=3155660 RepID=UPI003407CA84